MAPSSGTSPPLGAVECGCKGRKKSVPTKKLPQKNDLPPFYVPPTTPIEEGLPARLPRATGGSIRHAPPVPHTGDRRPFQNTPLSAQKNIPLFSKKHTFVFKKTYLCFFKNIPMIFQKHTYDFSKTHLCFFRNIPVFFQKHTCVFSRRPCALRYALCLKRIRPRPPMEPLPSQRHAGAFILAWYWPLPFAQ